MPLFHFSIYCFSHPLMHAKRFFDSLKAALLRAIGAVGAQHPDLIWAELSRPDYLHVTPGGGVGGLFYPELNERETQHRDYPLTMALMDLMRQLLPRIPRSPVDATSALYAYVKLSLRTVLGMWSQRPDSFGSSWYDEEIFSSLLKVYRRSRDIQLVVKSKLIFKYECGSISLSFLLSLCLSILQLPFFLSPSYLLVYEQESNEINSTVPYCCFSVLQEHR